MEKKKITAKTNGTTHVMLKPLFNFLRFKPDKSQVFKDIHDWKFEVIKGDLDKVPAILKISHNFHRLGYFEILNEIAADNLIKRFEHKSKKRAPHYRRVLLTGSDANYTWLAKEFVGSPFGVSYYVINPKFKKNQKQLVNKSFDELDRLQAIPFPEFQHFIPQRFPSVDTATIERRLNRIYQGKHKKTLHFFLDNQRLLHEKKVFIHGDFIISNMIVDHGIVYLTDFEFASSDHPMADVARLWKFSHLNPTIRSEIIKRYVKSKQDEKVFLVALARDLLYPLISYGRLGHKSTSASGQFDKDSTIEAFQAIGGGLKNIIALAEAQAQKYAPLEKQLIDPPYR